MEFSMKKPKSNTGFTIIEMIVVMSILGMLVGVTVTLFSVGLRYFGDNTNRVYEQVDVRMVMYDITQQLRASEPDEVVVQTANSILVDDITYSYNTSEKKLYKTVVGHDPVIIAHEIETFVVSIIDDTINIYIKASWNDTGVSTKVTLREIPTPTPKTIT